MISQILKGGKFLVVAVGAFLCLAFVMMIPMGSVGKTVLKQYQRVQQGEDKTKVVALCGEPFVKQEGYTIQTQLGWDGGVVEGLLTNQISETWIFYKPSIFRPPRYYVAFDKEGKAMAKNLLPR